MPKAQQNCSFFRRKYRSCCGVSQDERDAWEANKAHWGHQRRALAKAAQDAHLACFEHVAKLQEVEAERAREMAREVWRAAAVAR